jgi:hypothetical protein
MLIKIHADNHWWFLTHLSQKKVASVPQAKPMHRNMLMSKNVVILNNGVGESVIILIYVTLLFP